LNGTNIKINTIRKNMDLALRKHKKFFFLIVFTSIDERFDYDEEIREITIGAIQGIIVVTVVHTERNGKIRLISARKATPKERRQYYEYLTATS
jgi:uncharacterized DUF497 family protein